MHTGVRPEDRNKKMVVYSVLCLENGKAYVGQTRQKLYLRWVQHLSCARRHTVAHGFAFYGAVQKYGPENFSVHVLQTCTTPEELNAAEVKWIEELRTFPPNLGFGYNLAGGGEGGGERSVETRAKLSALHTGKKLPPHTAAQNAATSLALMGRKFTAKHCANISIGKTGTKHTAEQNAAKSKRQLGGKLPPRTPKHCAAISAGKKGFKHTEEWKRALSNRMKGSKHTDETRAAMSVAQKLRRQKEREALETSRVVPPGAANA